VGLALGLTLGAIGFLRASMTPASVLGNADRWMLGLVIAQSVAAICLWGTLVGSMLPLVFKRLGFDPGYASSPFVATFVDVTGIVIYFSIAKVFLL
jgi:magnesium transporter